MLIIYFLAALKFFLPLLTHADFEFHRDELLYIAMGNHLAWGYLENPPMIGVLAALTRLLFGDSLWALHFFPALSGAAVVILIGLMAHELGGGRFAQVLAAFAYIMAPAFMRSTTLFQPVCFDQLAWAAVAYLAILLLKKATPQRWLLFGVAIGLGLLTKYTMLFFAFALLLGILLTPARRMLHSKWPWLAVGIAFVMILPNLLWQQTHGWPVIEHMQTLSRNQLTHVEPAGFILMQALMSFAAFPVWMFGLYFYFSQAGKTFRAIGWSYVACFALLLFLSGKVYYLLPAYPMLFAAGGVMFEKYVARTQRLWLRPALLGFIFICNLIGVPHGVPLLSISSFEKYATFTAKHMGSAEPLRWEDGKLHLIPQDYADMLGWENQAATVAQVYRSLTPREREQCVILASNYGQAGALQHYARQYGLPQVISYHGSFYLWGPGNASKEILLTVGIDAEDLQPHFQSVEQVGMITHAFARENNVPIMLCRNANVSLQEIWPRLASERF